MTLKISIVMLLLATSGCSFYGVPSPNMPAYTVAGTLLSRSNAVIVTTSESILCVIFQQDSQSAAENCSITSKEESHWQADGSGNCFYELTVLDGGDSLALNCNDSDGASPCFRDNKTIISIEPDTRLSGYETDLQDKHDNKNKIEFLDSCDDWTS